MHFKNSVLSVFFGVMLSVWGGLFSTSVLAAGGALPLADIGEDGMYIQPWFHESFLDLSEDLAEAEAEGKRLMIVWEQRGCPYCKRMHEVNLRIPRIVDTLKSDFMVIQLNLWGDREVTDFDGEVLKEKDLANKWRVMFTPTLQFFPATAKELGGQSGVTGEVVRIPGYFKPFHFYFLLRYAKTGGYETEPSFQRWLGGIGEKLEEKGVTYDLYADDLPANLPADL
jgi:thioredoxin-related protein